MTIKEEIEHNKNGYKLGILTEEKMRERINEITQKNNIQLYKVQRVYFDKTNRITIANYLTEEDAQNIVKEDIKENPKGEKTMLIYNKQ